jgi:hypothetical protein
LRFAGGASVELAERREVPAGGLSAAIALPGGGQRLRAVELAWRAEAGTGKEIGPVPGYGDLAEVVLLGLAA